MIDACHAQFYPQNCACRGDARNHWAHMRDTHRIALRIAHVTATRTIIGHVWETRVKSFYELHTLR